MANENNRRCNLKLAIGIMLAMAAGAMVTIAGFILTVIYLFTTAHLHAARTPSISIYLVSPALGALVALAGSVLALRKWLNSRESNGNETGT